IIWIVLIFRVLILRVLGRLLVRLFVPFLVIRLARLTRRFAALLAGRFLSGFAARLLPPGLAIFAGILLVFILRAGIFFLVGLLLIRPIVRLFVVLLCVRFLAVGFLASAAGLALGGLTRLVTFLIA